MVKNGNQNAPGFTSIISTPWSHCHFSASLIFCWESSRVTRNAPKLTFCHRWALPGLALPGTAPRNSQTRAGVGAGPANKEKVMLFGGINAVYVPKGSTWGRNCFMLQIPQVTPSCSPRLIWTCSGWVPSESLHVQGRQLQRATCSPAFHLRELPFLGFCCYFSLPSNMLTL